MRRRGNAGRWMVVGEEGSGDEWGRAGVKVREGRRASREMGDEEGKSKAGKGGG